MSTEYRIRIIKYILYYGSAGEQSNFIFNEHSVNIFEAIRVYHNVTSRIVCNLGFNDSIAIYNLSK